MDWPSLERWERFAVSVLAEEGRGPEAALDVLAGAAEEARRWTPAAGPFGPFFEGVLAAALPRGANRRSRPSRGALRDGFSSPRDSAGGGPEAWQLVADCVPRRALLPAAPEGLGEADDQWVAPAWPAFSRPIRRWLAAKAFASWVALQGEGLRTTVAFLRVALGVLRAEAARGSAEAARPARCGPAPGGHPPRRPPPRPPRRPRGPRAAAESRRGRGGPHRRVVASRPDSP